MFKKIKIKNSTILLMGIILILMGICVVFVEHFNKRKNEAFSEMNILLYESETPSSIESEEEIDLDSNLEEDIDSPEEDTEPSLENNDSSQEEIKYNYIGLLEIPKINLKRGFLDLNSRYNKVNYNITVINGSTFPNEENNNLILAAHSGNCSVCFFDKLFNLSKDDKAYIHYNNVKYTYKLVNTYEVEKDGTVAIYRDYEKNVLTLITCTKYSDTKQTVFIFELDK
ncbi:MAG: sortase [Firmicutes bacterium]|nr:sortase [Bacillota bacterium]